jgi:hypothetical protein
MTEDWEAALSRWKKSAEPVQNTPGPISKPTRQMAQDRVLIPGVDNFEVQLVLGAVHVVWMMGSHKLPSLKDINDRIPQLPQERIVRILKHKKFRSLALGRGIQWPERWTESIHNGAVLRSQLRPEQAHVIAIMLEPGRENFHAKLKKAGITSTTWMGWLNEPLFAEAVRVASENMLGAAQTAVHASVINGASSGNVQAQRLYYELTGRHDPVKQQMQDMNNVVRLLLEVLTRHVTDPGVLEKIQSDLGRVMAGQNLREIETIPANYTVVEGPVGGSSNEGRMEVEEGFFEFKPEE